MRLLDLFCGAGGAAMGYHRAGFDEIVGVDIKPQPHYPFEFIQADWEEPLAFLPGLWEREDEHYAIHASPPCQRYSNMTRKWGRNDDHPDLIDVVRERIDEIEPPLGWVIENVSGAPLADKLMLCGSMFGLRAWVCGCGVAVPEACGKYGCPNCEGEQAKRGTSYELRRHRVFECSTFIFPPASCAHVGKALPMYGHAGGSSKRDGLKFPGVARLARGQRHRLDDRQRTEGGDSARVHGVHRPSPAGGSGGTMLILKLRDGEEITIGAARVVVHRDPTNTRRITLLIDAPREVPVLRANAVRKEPKG